LRCGDETKTIPERKAKVRLIRWRIPSWRFPFAAEYFLTRNNREGRWTTESIPFTNPVLEERFRDRREKK
jgi:hypothetical protein